MKTESTRQHGVAECADLEKLRSESSELFAAYEALRDDVKQTAKAHPSYAEKALALKKIKGQLAESQKRFHQHVKDHRCR